MCLPSRVFFVFVCISGRAAKAVLPILALLAVTTCTQAQQLNVGDVAVATQGGYQVWSPTGTLKATINAPAPSDSTAACAFDSTFRMRGVIFSEAEVERFAIPSPFNALSAQTATTAASPQSVVFDGDNKFYVGHAGGTIKQYNAAGTLLNTYTVPVDSTTFFALDISADGQTLYYSSGGSFIRTVNAASGAPGASIHVVFPSVLEHTYGVRLLPPFNGTAFLVASGRNIYSIGVSGAIVTFTNTYASGLDGASNWRALALASPPLPTFPGPPAISPTPTQFWAVNSVSGNLFEFDISGGKTAGPYATGASGDGGQSGVCVVGGFSGAQPVPIVAQVDLNVAPNNSNQFTFTTPSTSVSLGNNVTGTSTSTNTLNESMVFVPHQSGPVQVTAWFIEIDSAGTSPVGTSDPANGSLPCLVTDMPSTNNGNRCGVVKVEFSPDSATVFSSVNFSLFTSESSVNPAWVSDEETTETTFVVDTGVGGTHHSTVYTLHEQPLSPSAGGEISCGYQTPVTTSPASPSGNTLPLKFSTAVSPADCRAKNYLNSSSLVPTVSLVKLDPSGLTGTQVLATTAGNSVGYRFSPPSLWIININMSSFPKGCYLATTIDASNQIGSFSYSATTNPAAVLISNGSHQCNGITLP
jgi:hypothetical protein